MDERSTQVLKQMAGAWRLASSEFRAAGGGVIHPLGEDALGLCLITENGYLSGQLMRQGRPNFAGGDQASGTPEELKAALEGYVAYYGPFDLDVDEGTLTTRVEGSLFPNWVGGDQIRFFELDGDRLTLTTPPMELAGQEFHGVLIWEKV